MSVTQSFLTITPTWENKKLTVTGYASVRESVVLRIVGCADDTSIVFKLSSENGRVDYAKFPNAVDDAWTVDEENGDLVGTLNLNTDLLVAAFAPWGPEDRIDLICTVASKTNSNLYALGHKQIGNWMENTDDPIAFSTPLADDISDLEQAFGSHDHDGSNSPKVDHANLIGKGFNTHDQIDSALTEISSTVSTHTSAISTNASNIAANAGAISSLDSETLKYADFSAIDSVPVSTATVKKLAMKLEELLIALKG